ncbi:barstar family protein [Ectopseudomonas chengduensis]
MKIEIDGDKVLNEQDFHRQLAVMLGVEEFYGCNLNALWDLLTGGVDRPIVLIWKSSETSRRHMGRSFPEIIELLDSVKKWDEELGRQEVLSYILE